MDISHARKISARRKVGRRASLERMKQALEKPRHFPSGDKGQRTQNGEPLCLQIPRSGETLNIRGRVPAPSTGIGPRASELCFSWSRMSCWCRTSFPQTKQNRTPVCRQAGGVRSRIHAVPWRHPWPFYLPQATAPLGVYVFYRRLQ